RRCPSLQSLALAPAEHDLRPTRLASSRTASWVVAAARPPAARRNPDRLLGPPAGRTPRRDRRQTWNRPAEREQRALPRWIRGARRPNHLCDRLRDQAPLLVFLAHVGTGSRSAAVPADRPPGCAGALLRRIRRRAGRAAPGGRDPGAMDRRRHHRTAP